MISDGTLVVESGQGTLQFPVDEVERIIALPNLPESKPVKISPVTLSSAPTSVATPDELLIRAAIQTGLEPEFVRSVAIVESGMRQEAISPKGATGLMQLMPFTAGKLGVDAKAADQNALGGAAYLRQLLIKYNGNSLLALAAYNAGPGAVDKYKGVPPYAETRKYVLKVLREYARQQQAGAARSKQMSSTAQTAPGSVSSLAAAR